MGDHNFKGSGILQEKIEDTRDMGRKSLIFATETGAISVSLCVGPKRRKGESQWSTEVFLGAAE